VFILVGKKSIKENLLIKRIETIRNELLRAKTITQLIDEKKQSGVVDEVMLETLKNEALKKLINARQALKELGEELINED